MKKITLVLLFINFLNVFSQEKPGDRAGTLFYPTIDRNEKTYDISVDLYELRNIKYIEAELYNINEVKLKSKLFKLVLRGKTLFLNEEAEGTRKDGPKIETFIYDIKFQLKNPDSKLGYMMLKIKVLDSDYQIVDFSKKVFY